MRQIVVGVDGSAESIVALNWAVSLATALDAEVTVVKAYRAAGSEVGPRYSERVHEEHLRRLEGSCGSRLDGLRHALAAVAGDPRQVLHRVAVERGADLLVVASSGASKQEPGFLHLGSVVEHLAHHTERPLAVINRGAAPTVERIIVAVDGSPHALAAVEWVRRLLDGGMTRATASAVAVDQPGLGLAADAPPDQWRREAERVIRADWARPLADFGDAFTAIAMPRSLVADAILGAADDAAADLIVLGARGLGRVSDLRVGGVALAVLHRATRPLVLVPADQAPH